jgi:flagellar biosynthesis protein FlhF
MIVRRYTGRGLEEIHDAIAREMGPHAVVVSTVKRRRRGLLGFPQTQFEVTAVAEDPKIPASIIRHDNTEHNPENHTELLEKQQIQYRGIRQAIRRIDDRLDDVDERIHGFAACMAESARTWLANVHHAWIPQLAEIVHKRTADKTPSFNDWQNALAKRLNTRPGLQLNHAAHADSPRVCLFVGTTGVGKTTTLAKIASHCVLNRKLNVGMVTLDTFRLGAIEQLREYAQLLGVELAVAFSANELHRRLAAFNDKDVVLIDTPGRSQFDPAGRDDVEGVIGSVDRLDVLLHIAADQRGPTAETILHQYRPLGPTGIVLTKIDEAVCCDGLTRLLDRADDIPVCYVTDGQRVPEDLHKADPDRLARLIITDHNRPRYRTENGSEPNAAPTETRCRAC